MYRTITGKIAAFIAILICCSLLSSTSAMAWWMPQVEPREATVLNVTALRTGPSMTSTSIIRYLEVSEKIAILQKYNYNWFEVEDSAGVAGYVSASQITTDRVQFINPYMDNETLGILKSGESFLGTPYEFGSDREDTSTFDCSDFIRHIIKEGSGQILPGSSRKQADYARTHGIVRTDVKALQAGDVVFFMKHRGSQPTDYEKVDKSTASVTHVGIVTGRVGGDIYMMHATKTANAFSGVKFSKLSGTSLEYRLLFGADVVNSTANRT